MNLVYLSIGSNVGNRLANLQYATKELIGIKDVDIVATSAIYETSAWGNENQNTFLNCCISIRTAKTAEDLLNKTILIELEMGRQKKEKWGPRIIDIDILFFNQLILNTPFLTIPHPYLHDRIFVLKPLNDIAHNFIHPIKDTSVNTLLYNCIDKGKIVITPYDLII